MGKIDLTIHKEGLAHNIQKAKENNIIIPTIAQMQNPDLIPGKIKEKLAHTGLWDVDPVNLFRISWHNEAKETGGLFQKVPNYVEIPSSISGVKCRILAMSGKWFPTGCHKVGASFGCLAQDHRRPDHRHPRRRVQRQGDLRQDVGAEKRPQHDDLQPVRRDGQPPVALQRHRLRPCRPL